MSENRLFLIPFNIPWDWTTDYTNQTAMILAKKSIVVCYLLGDSLSVMEYLRQRRLPVFIKRFSPNMYLYFPVLVIPFRRFKWITRINGGLNNIFLGLFLRYLEFYKKIKGKVLWVFDPQLYPFVVRCGKNFFTVYDCIDYYPSKGKSAIQKRKTIEQEKALCRKSDLVVAISNVLVKHLRRYGIRVNLVPQGFRNSVFRNFGKATPTIKRSSRPLIGFVGALSYRIDFRLLFDLALNNPQWDFALWGPVQEMNLSDDRKVKAYNELSRLPNVIFGNSAKAGVPYVIRQFDIGIIPYDSSLEFNKFSYPMKLFEYFYEGRPVVATEIVELKNFPKFVFIGKTAGDWERIIKKILKNSWPKSYSFAQKNLALENTWQKKVDAVINLIGNRV